MVRISSILLQQIARTAPALPVENHGLSGDRVAVGDIGMIILLVVERATGALWRSCAISKGAEKDGSDSRGARYGSLGSCS